MIILIFVFAAGLSLLSFWFANEGEKYGKNGCLFLGIATGVCGCIFAGLTLIWFTVEVQNVLQYKIIDEKIAIYQEENEKIENQIDALVKNYMDYESATYAEFKDKDAITLVTLYPELKSDKLVEKQLEIYNSNNKKIKKLKTEKLDYSISLWLICFK